MSEKSTVGSAPDPASAPDAPASARTSRPRPGPRHATPAAAPDPAGAGPSRRWVLATAGAAVVAGGAGVGAALLQDHVDKPTPRPAPDALLTAVAAERELIADLDATTGGSASVRRGIVATRADHAAHLQALTALAAGYDRPAGATAAPRGTPRTAAALAAAERRASDAAARHAAALDGRAAVVLASIAASEATHAELLT